MKILYFSANMKSYSSASYQQDLINSLSKKCELIFWGPGHAGFDANFKLDKIKNKFSIDKDDTIIVGHSWLSDIPLSDNLNLKNYYKWIDEKIINKNSLEYCGELKFFEHPGPKIFFINKEYVSLKEKLNFAKKNNFDYVLTSNTDYKKYEEKTNLKFVFFPYAISNDFLLGEDYKKKYDLFFSGLIQNQYFSKLTKIKSKRLEIQKKLFYNVFDLPIFRKTQNFKGKVFWNSYTGLQFKDLILKVLKKYKRLSNSDYILKLHESKVVLNTLSPANLIGPRFYETMASKAICLAESSEIINKVFTPMEHYVPINNFDEFFEKLNFCLSDSLKIKYIKNNAYNYVISNHTYDIRAEKIISLILNIKK